MPVGSVETGVELKCGSHRELPILYFAAPVSAKQKGVVFCAPLLPDDQMSVAESSRQPRSQALLQALDRRAPASPPRLVAALSAISRTRSTDAGQLTHALNTQAALQGHHFSDSLVDVASRDLTCGAPNIRANI